MMTFDEAVLAVRALEGRGWRLGLDRMEELCSRLGVASGGMIPYIHVAGTNGKGSTVAMCESILRASGLRVGATYSPFVYDVCERITGPEGMISREDFARAAEAVLKVSREMEDSDFGGATEFEAKTAMGFWIWNQSALDAVVLETGLGGRLDATNIVLPRVSVITSIGLDHVAILGDTVEKIAREKAGIIKPGVPVVVGRVSDSVFAVIDEVAREMGSTAIRFEEGMENHGYELGLRGEIMKVNAWMAMTACQLAFGVGEESIREGLRSVTMPGRFEEILVSDSRWVFDGAHNSEAIRELVTSWKSEFGDRRATVIFGMLDGHESEPILEQLAEITGEMVVVPINWSRTRDPEELVQEAEKSIGEVKSFWSVKEAVESVDSDLVLVTGSYYLLGEVKEALLS